jgi:hypothetical protein
MREAEEYCLDPLEEMELCLHLLWRGANILIKENMWGAGARRGIIAWESGKGVFGHGWCV